MAADNKKPGEVQALLDVEFVPMRVAAAMAYFDITGHRRVVGSEAELTEISRLVAIALSAVAPIYHVGNGEKQPLALTNLEIHELLFKAKSPSLGDVAIKRDDLQRAVATLKEARTSFGKPG